MYLHINSLVRLPTPAKKVIGKKKEKPSIVRKNNRLSRNFETIDTIDVSIDCSPALIFTRFGIYVNERSSNAFASVSRVYHSLSCLLRFYAKRILSKKQLKSANKPYNV